MSTSTWSSASRRRAWACATLVRLWSSRTIRRGGGHGPVRLAYSTQSWSPWSACSPCRRKRPLRESDVPTSIASHAGGRSLVLSLPFCLTHLGVWLPGRAASYSASVRSGRGSSERYSGSISVAFYTSSARAAGGGAPTGGLGSQRCIVPRHVNIPTATRCGYLDKPGATSERAMARGAPRSRPRGAQTAPWTGRLARTKERPHSWPVRLA